MAGGWAYRVDYPYYSWAETVVRPRVRRRDFAPLVTRLNEVEGSHAGRWRVDKSEMTSAVKFVNQGGTLGASTLAPDAIAKVLRGSLAKDGLLTHRA